MNPSREEIEELLGGKLPPDVAIEELVSWPPPDAGESGAKFDLVAVIKDKFAVLKKTWAGRIVKYYIVAFGLGFPIPSPYQIVVTSYDHVADYSKILYQRAIDPSPEPLGGYLVSVPPEFQPPPSGEPLSLDILPKESGIYPLSGSDYRSLQLELG